MNDTPIFLAVCKDRANDPNGFVYTVYLVNNSAADLTGLKYETYGYCTMDDELVTTTTYRAELPDLRANSAVEIEQDDEGTFDFVILFTFTYCLAGQPQTCTFQINKYLKGGVKPLSPLPVLQTFGRMFTPIS